MLTLVVTVSSDLALFPIKGCSFSHTGLRFFPTEISDNYMFNKDFMKKFSRINYPYEAGESV